MLINWNNYCTSLWHKIERLKLARTNGGNSLFYEWLSLHSGSRVSKPCVAFFQSKQSINCASRECAWIATLLQTRSLAGCCFWTPSDLTQPGYTPYLLLARFIGMSNRDELIPRVAVTPSSPRLQTSQKILSSKPKDAFGNKIIALSQWDTLCSNFWQKSKSNIIL